MQAGEHCLGACGGLGLIAKLMDHCFEEPRLRGIGINDQDCCGHAASLRHEPKKLPTFWIRSCEKTEKTK